MKEEERLAIIAEIIEMSCPPIARPGDFVIEEYREVYLKERGEPITESSAKRYLDQAVKDGLLETEEAMYQGKLRKVYRRV